MGIKLSKSAYELIIHEDIETVKKHIPDCLEKGHIIDVLMGSIDYSYSKEMSELEAENRRLREYLEMFANMEQKDATGIYVRGTESYPVEEAARAIQSFMDLVNHIAKEALGKEE